MNVYLKLIRPLVGFTVGKVYSSRIMRDDGYHILATDNYSLAMFSPSTIEQHFADLSDDTKTVFCRPLPFPDLKKEQTNDLETNTTPTIEYVVDAYNPPDWTFA